ncbi:MAG: adenylosuccinate synthase [Oscillospiraceae bacterium]|jgi:adenylosuccinate synthase|nr:adenylosuccinate synthase [Oscillospiraceae bacterium]
MITAVVGINWGDEGKGRIVDLFSAGSGIVARYQGGNNAGHTVVNDQGKFVLNLLPSGIFRPETLNVMGGGMVIDLEHLWGEITALTKRDVAVTPDNLKISEKAFICMPYHKQLDVLEETRLGAFKQGSTQRGIAPAYADKYYRKGLRLGDLLDPSTLRGKVKTAVDWKNLTVAKGYGAEALTVDGVMAWLGTFGGPLLPYIADTDALMESAAEGGQQILLEAQLGALRDIDFGIYPYTTSSSALAAYAPIGAGIPARRIDRVVGVIKAYSSSVGGGPFVCEFSGGEAEKLREAGHEYGAATGRPRRVGGFDVVASRYGVRVQGPSELALTNLDVLSIYDRIPVCVAYEVDGEVTTAFPSGSRLERAKPIYEYLEGFHTDITGCRAFSDLPAAAADYVAYIEKAMGCPITTVSVGPERNAYFVR